MYWIVYGYMKKVGCIEPSVYYNYHDAREEFNCLSYEHKAKSKFSTDGKGTASCDDGSIYIEPCKIKRKLFSFYY